ncbi:methylthioribulose 1-phosphate dehydratase [Marinicrinis lubricantis]|uniref:Methylthioribulose-1-phosphate dehydratase n=1 Tax=Marinicrinis lubricantis TaxID=2086470 RepID=A0ABW1ILW3_9BACL
MTRSDIPAEQIQSAYAELANIKGILADRGWFPATSGNLSIRVGDYTPDQFQFAITASGKDKSVQTPEDYLLVDENGVPLLPTKLKPSAETLIHCEIYRLTGCGAVYHVHTVFNNLASAIYETAGAIPLKGIEIIKAFNIWEENAEIHVPILPNYAEIPKIAELVEGAINPQVPGILLHNHGIYAWGATPFDAKRHLEAFEFCFEYAVRMKSLIQ